jgi:hypothetical protein
MGDSATRIFRGQRHTPYVTCGVITRPGSNADKALLGSLAFSPAA